VMHNSKWQAKPSRMLPNWTIPVEEDLTDFNWVTAGWNQMLAFAFPDGAVMLLYGRITKSGEGIEAHFSYKNILGQEVGPQFIEAPLSPEEILARQEDD
jgi:hypothetical protein